MKELDLKKSVHDLTAQYPELIPILKELGFVAISNPIARNTVGRVTTVSQGAKKMGLELGEVVKKLEEEGFIVKQ
ncbi:MAG: DUF1858 domain-containing protein [Chloroflexi bacterium]|nr:DUF1858 domain-containing protein [Chloroflexota bacterium]